MLLPEEVQFLSRLPFLRHVQVFFVWDLACLLLEISMYFPFLFPSNFCSFDSCVVCIVSSRSNQSSSAFSNVLFKFLYRYIDAIFNAGESSPSFFLDTYSLSTSPLGCKALSLFYSLRVFHISVSCWSFTEVRVTASLLKSPGLFSVFWPILIMLYFGWSPFDFLFPSPPFSVQILWWPYREHQL